jgi:hypothetical protein
MANGLDTNADSKKNPEEIENLLDNPMIVHGQRVITLLHLPEIVYPHR